MVSLVEPFAKEGELLPFAKGGREGFNLFGRRRTPE